MICLSHLLCVCVGVWGCACGCVGVWGVRVRVRVRVRVGVGVSSVLVSACGRM